MNAWQAATLCILSSWFYRYADTPELRGEVFYVTQGVVACWLFLHAAKGSRKIAALLLVYAAWEECQVAVCGIGSWGIHVPALGGLCVSRFGVWPYAALASAAIVYLWRKHARPNKHQRCH